MRPGGGSFPTLPAGVTVVTESAGGGSPLHQHAEWTVAFPWLVQGTTRGGAGGLDMGLFGAVPAAVALARWRQLREGLGMPGVVHARQVHGAAVVWHGCLPPGLMVADDADGHGTAVPGVLLAVSVADCVPILLVAPTRPAIALLHGGWRGVAAGILEAGISLLTEQAGAEPELIHLHCGPAICGSCYEIGPEVPVALDIPVPAGQSRLDLRAVIAMRALAAGIPAHRISVSSHCTRCGGGQFWSHRGGCRERQLSVAGIRC